MARARRRACAIGTSRSSSPHTSSVGARTRPGSPLLSAAEVSDNEAACASPRARRRAAAAPRSSRSTRRRGSDRRAPTPRGRRGRTRGASARRAPGGARRRADSASLASGVPTSSRIDRGGAGDEPLHALRMTRRQRHGDAAAHRVAEHVGARDAERAERRVHDVGERGRVVAERRRRRAIALAEARQIDRDQLALGAEPFDAAAGSTSGSSSSRGGAPGARRRACRRGARTRGPPASERKNRGDSRDLYS